MDQLYKWYVEVRFELKLTCMRGVMSRVVKLSSGLGQREKPWETEVGCRLGRANTPLNQASPLVFVYLLFHVPLSSCFFCVT